VGRLTLESCTVQTLTGTKFLMVVDPGTPDIDDILRTL
jgi:hypothetical protein